MAVKLIAFAGSARMNSFNHRLVQIAAEGARKAGAEVTLLNMRDYRLPLFDEDLEKEQGKPDLVRRLEAMFREHDGMLIACPEYNGSITPLLKNTIDWISRPVEGQPPLAAFKGEFATLMAASPGGLGGLRGLVHVRAILSNTGVTVLPNQVAVGQASEAFDDSGKLVDESQHEKVLALGNDMTQLLSKLGDAD